MRIVVTGAAGMLGTEVVAAYRKEAHEVVALTRDDLDLEDRDAAARIVATAADVIVHCAAWTDVDGCARDPDRAMRINGTGARLVAEGAKALRALCVLVSTNEVFDGLRDEPYTEDDEPRPVTAYGRSKLAGEAGVGAIGGRFLILRTAWLFAADRRGFPARIAAAADAARRDGRPLRVVDDEWGNPTPARALAESIKRVVQLAISAAAPDVLHLAGEPPTTRYEWAQVVLGSTAELEAIPSSAYERDSKPPLRAVLSMARAHALGFPPIAWRP